MSEPDLTPMSDDELDRTMDDALRGAFGPPREEHFVGVARDAVRPVTPVHPWRRLLLSAAALLVVLVWWLRSPRPGEADLRSGANLGALWVAAYDDAARDGAEHGSCCDTGCDVEQLCRAVCGQGLCHDGAGKADLVGSYKGSPIGGCAAFVMRVDDVTVCVFVMPRSDDRSVELPHDRQLVVGRRELGELVLYSVSRPLEVDALAGFSLP